MNLFSSQSYIFKKTRPFIVTLIVVSLLHNFIIFPVQAAMGNASESLNENTHILVIKKPGSETNHFEQLSSDDSNTIINFTLVPETPVITKVTPKTNSNPHLVSLTAYSSDAAQTDDDPCTTANGFNVCKHGVEDTVAANFLPMGTQITIPSLFGDRVFTVRDRMNRRMTNRVDVWMTNRGEAIQFGIQHAEIVVLN